MFRHVPMALTFHPSTAFRADLEKEVAAYFKTTGQPRRDVPRMYLKTATLFAWLIGSYVGLVFLSHTWWVALPFAISLGLAMAGIGFSVQHDAGHGAYSERRWVNRLMAFSLDLLGGSSYFWSFKHNIAHHTYPNVQGYDDDLVVGAFGRLSPHDRWSPIFRLQHFYMWVLYGMLSIRWTLIDDYHSMIDPGIGQTPVRRPGGWDLARFVIGKTMFLLLAFALPIWLHGLLPVLLFFVVVSFVLGVVLATVFQLAHCVEEATFPTPVEGKIQRDFAAHQLDTTVDFGRKNWLLTWYVGGLNYQIEHHLFPHICHVHYPALAPIVERVSLAHGVPYRYHEGTATALRSHYRWLRRMGQRPALEIPRAA